MREMEEKERGKCSSVAGGPDPLTFTPSEKHPSNFSAAPGSSAQKPFIIWLHLPPCPQYHPQPQLHTCYSAATVLGFSKQPSASLCDFVSAFFFLGYPSRPVLVLQSSALVPLLSFAPALCFSNTALVQSQGLTQCILHTLSPVVPALHCLLSV